MATVQTEKAKPKLRPLRTVNGSHSILFLDEIHRGVPIAYRAKVDRPCRTAPVRRRTRAAGLAQTGPWRVKSRHNRNRPTPCSPACLSVEAVRGAVTSVLDTFRPWRDSSRCDRTHCCGIPQRSGRYESMRPSLRDCRSGHTRPSPAFAALIAHTTPVW